MSDKKDKSYEKEFKKTDDFAERTKLTNELYNMVIEQLDLATDTVFKKAGYERIETPTSFYANGKPYGFGAEENKFQVRYASKTSTYIDKQIILGAKRMQSEIILDLNANMFKLIYKTTEQDVYKHYMINEQLIMSTKDMASLKKELKSLFTKIAEKELGYLTNTKLGVEDKTEMGIRPIVSINENKNTMNKLTLKDLFSDGKEDKKTVKESVENIESNDDSKNIEKVIDLNTVPVEGEKNKFLLFDDEEDGMEDSGAIFEKYSHVDKEKFKTIFNDTLKNMFGVSKFKSLTPVEKKDLFKAIDAKISTKEEAPIEEITTAGPAGAGAGRYDTPSAWKPVGMLKNKKSPSEKKDKTEVGAPYTVPAKEGVYEGEDKKDLAKKIIEERQAEFNKTNYAKSKNSKRPKVDKDYNIIPQVKKESFYTPVVLNKDGYAPKGMEHNYIAGQHEKNVGGSYAGDNEGTVLPNANSKPLKRKFATIKENEEKGINKRYIITEKTSDEYEKERWAKLSGFKTFESILKFEEDLINEKVDINEEFNPGKYEAESKAEESGLDAEINDILGESDDSSKETVLVEKPGSTFGLCYKFYKEDFINENKTYILDLNSRVFVANPNSKK